jgi:segregation and condensation protein B
MPMAMRVVWPDEQIQPRTGAAKMPRKRKSEETQDLERLQAPADDSQIATEPAETAEIAQNQAEAADGQVEDWADEADDGQPEVEVDLRLVEALLFSTHHPLTPQRLTELLQVKGQKSVKRAVQSLNKQYEETGRSFRVEQVAGGYQMLSLPEYGDLLKKLHQREIDSKLTKAALETLAIIAYKQPILRADVEAIRGVACGETIRSLMEKHLVKIAGRAEEPGRPILYGTTRRFLELFGLNSVKDLPQSEALPAPPDNRT